MRLEVIWPDHTHSALSGKETRLFPVFNPAKEVESCNLLISSNSTFSSSCSDEHEWRREGKWLGKTSSVLIKFYLMFNYYIASAKDTMHL
jgi:hypothetical protein